MFWQGRSAKSAQQRNGTLHLLRMSSRPDEVREEQDDHEGAPGLELFKEARQDVTKDKKLQAGDKGGTEELE